MRKAIAATLSAAVTFTSGAALAQEFGSQGTFAISAERVFGLPYYEHIEVEIDRPPPGPGNWQWDDEYTTFGFAWGWPHTPYTLPRFGVDYFVIDSLSLGGSLAFVATDHDQDPGGDDDRNMFLFAPRVGYAIPFGVVAGFWPRGGITFVAEGGDGPDSSELALTLEAMFWIAPAEGVAFLVGPTLDFGITGEEERPDPADRDRDLHRTVVGIAVGLMGWL